MSNIATFFFAPPSTDSSLLAPAITATEILAAEAKIVFQFVLALIQRK